MGASEKAVSAQITSCRCWCRQGDTAYKKGTKLLGLLETSCLPSLCISLSSELRKRHSLMLLMLPEATLWSAVGRAHSR